MLVFSVLGCYNQHGSPVAQAGPYSPRWCSTYLTLVGELLPGRGHGCLVASWAFCLAKFEVPSVL